jgi:hypothetical protein
VALVIGAWSWGTKYGSQYVSRLRAGVARHLKQPYRFVVLNPEPEDMPLTKIPGCFCRLRAFDPIWQARQGITDRFVCLDLDMVITGTLDHIFDRADAFTILQGVNTSNPCRYNGSAWMLRAGTRPEVWRDFSLTAASRVPFDSFPDDQAWFAAKIPDAGAWTAQDGVYAFKKRGWPKGDDLPANASIVAFPGWRDPARFTNIDWVARNWLE